MPGPEAKAFFAELGAGWPSKGKKGHLKGMGTQMKHPAWFDGNQHVTASAQVIRSGSSAQGVRSVHGETSPLTSHTQTIWGFTTACLMASPRRAQLRLRVSHVPFRFYLWQLDPLQFWAFCQAPPLPRRRSGGFARVGIDGSHLC